jgi:exosortase
LTTDHTLAGEKGSLKYRVAGFGVVCLLPVVFLLPELRSLFVFILNDQTYTHIPLIPVVSLSLIYLDRKAIFQRTGHAWRAGGATVFVGMGCLLLERLDSFKLGVENQNSLLVFGLVVFLLGAFLLGFGLDSFRAALLPLLFLIFMVPIPDPPLANVILFLQAGSARCAEWLFRALGVPFLRSGFEFALPGVTIMVAEECSGIRSTLALVILTVLASCMFLRNGWNRAILCLFVIPMSVIKNGFRIAFLSTMAIYVNPSFLTGRLHTQGGVVFYMLALIPIFFLFRFLRKRECKSGGPAPAGEETLAPPVGALR